MADKKPYGEDVKYADPGYKKDGVARYPIDTEAHARAALSYFSMPKNHMGYTEEQIAEIMGRIRAACRKFGIELADAQRSDLLVGEIEERNGISTVAAVNQKERIVTVIAVPYESPALVPYRGDIWNEVFERSAFADIKHVRPGRIRANRGHNRGLTVGKAVKFFPDRTEGLVADVYISDTDLGRETLQLAEDDCLSASVGFGLRSGGQRLEPLTKTRRITAAKLDHVAFVEDPAYADANVLAVRSNGIFSPDEIRAMERVTPNKDQSLAEMRDIMAWTARWLNK
jgi:phage head maturation protease